MNLEEFYRLPDVYYEACAHLRVYGCTGGDTLWGRKLVARALVRFRLEDKKQALRERRAMLSIARGFPTKPKGLAKEDTSGFVREDCAIYARVSTTDQSTEPQTLDLRAYARARGWNVYQEYIDEGISGTRDSRPDLNSLMNDARKRKFDVVLVWRFDRFARSTKHLVLALEEFKNLGIDFVSYRECRYSSPLGAPSLRSFRLWPSGAISSQRGSKREEGQEQRNEARQARDPAGRRKGP